MVKLSVQLYTARCAIILGLGFAVTGCETVQSIENIKKQTIVVRTPYVTGAKCKLVDKRGTTWRVKSTPEVVVVRAGNPPLHITCTHKNYKKTIATFEADAIDFEEYQGFLEEVGGIVKDPFSKIATKYPGELKVWMEPYQWASDEQMREWAYDKNLWEQQRQAKKQALAQKKEDAKNRELELKHKYSDRIKQQRKRLYNSKWFQWLASDENKRSQETVQDIDKHIDYYEPPKPKASAPVNVTDRDFMQDVRNKELQHRMVNPSEQAPSVFEFWKHKWFKQLKSAGEKAK